MIKSGKGKAIGFPSFGRKSKEMLDEDDVEITVNSEVTDDSEEDESTEVASSVVVESPAFVNGFVHPALRNAVNARWRRSDESDLLYRVMSGSLAIEGVYVGDIAVHSSFVTKSGGMALL